MGSREARVDSPHMENRNPEIVQLKFVIVSTVQEDAGAQQMDVDTITSATSASGNWRGFGIPRQI